VDRLLVWNSYVEALDLTGNIDGSNWVNFENVRVILWIETWMFEQAAEETADNDLLSHGRLDQ